MLNRKYWGCSVVLSSSLNIEFDISFERGSELCDDYLPLSHSSPSDEMFGSCSSKNVMIRETLCNTRSLVGTSLCAHHAILSSNSQPWFYHIHLYTYPLIHVCTCTNRWDRWWSIIVEIKLQHTKVKCYTTATMLVLWILGPWPNNQEKTSTAKQS